jgi:hypothetical protein
MTKQDLILNVFGKQPAVPPAPVALPSIPAPVKYNTRDSVSRESIAPEISAQAQAMVWGNGNPPPPKPPTNKMVDKGQAPAMSNKEGWGQT